MHGFGTIKAVILIAAIAFGIGLEHHGGGYAVASSVGTVMGC